MSSEPQELELIEKSLKVSQIYYKTHVNAPEAQAYLEQRGMSVQTIWKFGVGYAPDKLRGLVDHFSAPKVRNAALVGGCLKKQSNSERLLDFFRGRLMFPIMNHDGVLCGFGGRLIKPGPDRSLMDAYPDFVTGDISVRQERLLDAAQSLFMQPASTLITVEKTSEHLQESGLPAPTATVAAQHLLGLMERDGLIKTSGEGNWRVVPKLPKYLNTAETPLFDKSELLYGFYQNKREIMASGEAILVEGYMDVTTLSEHGFPIGTAPMGTALTVQQLKLLRDHGVKNLWLCLDGDAAGLKAMHRSMEVLLQHYDPTLNVGIILLHDGHDPDSLLRAEGPDSFAKAKANATPLDEFIHETCTRELLCFKNGTRISLEDRAHYLKELELFIQKSTGVLRERLVDRAAEFSGLSTKDIYALNNVQNVDALIDEWHPLVLLASRWMAHDQTNKVRAQLKNLVSHTHGLDALAGLAKALSSNADLSGDQRQLQQYALAHGPLEQSELRELAGKWGAWLQNVAMSELITKIQDNPDDSQSTKAFKSMLRVG